MTIRLRRSIRELWRAAAAVAVLAVTLATACSKGDGATGPVTPATPEGAYTLQTIDAKAMPYAMYAETDYKLDVMSGTLSVTANGKWIAKTVTRETIAGNVSTYTDSTFGTWSVPAGTRIGTFINAETSLTSSVSWTASTLSLDDVDGTIIRKLVYKRN